MTKEELEKEAEEYIGNKSCDTDDYSCGFLPSTIEEMLIEFAEPREKRIIELEALIEKMKRCAICKYSTDLGYCKIRCNGGECDNYSSWEIKEDD